MVAPVIAVSRGLAYICGVFSREGLVLGVFTVILGIADSWNPASFRRLACAEILTHVANIQY